MEKYEVAQTAVQIPVTEIYSDSNFNCRKDLTYISVSSLADSIRSDGLRTPITVRLHTDLPDNKKYKIVAGHRRFAACRLLKWESIPAFIIEADDQQAKIINLSENIDRKDLSILEEARAISEIFAGAGASAHQVAKALNKSYPWARRRLFLMKLDPEVQAYFHEGLLPQSDIDVLFSYPTSQHLEVVKNLSNRLGKSRRMPKRMSSKAITKNKKMPQPLEKVRLMAYFLLRQNITGLPIKVLLWSLGELTNTEIQKEIAEVVKNPDLLLYDERSGDDYKKKFLDT